MIDLKKIYYDLRQGYAQFGFVLAVGNFIIIMYGLTDINKIISIWVFAGLFIIMMFVGLVLLGRFYRTKQNSVEHDLSYFQMRENAKTNRILFDAIIKLNEKFEIDSDKLIERRDFLSGIERKEKK